MIYKEDTICAIATAMIDAGIGIIRVSGEKSIDIVSRLYIDAKGNYSLTDYQSHTINYGFIVDDNKNKVDEVMVSIMKGPRSYTREDVVEINTHGGRIVMSILSSLNVNLVMLLTSYYSKGVTSALPSPSVVSLKNPAQFT